MAERIDDLQCNGYKIIQDTDGFCFGMDAVLLANYALQSVTEETKLLDLCSGTGIVPLLLAAKTRCKDITGLELQKDVADMAERSVKLNKQEGRMKIIQGDLREIRNLGMNSSMNVVTCNPPYMNAGLRNTTDRKLISRHEVMCTLADVCLATALTLKSNGRFYMVHRPNRLVDIFNELRKVKIEPKRIRLVHPYENSEANMVLLEAVKGGNTQLTVEKPLIVYKDKNIYTDEILRIYAVS